MNSTNRKMFLLTMASVETATGVCVLFWPAGLFALFLGLERASIEATFVGRIAGAALLALGVASWIAKDDTLTTAQRGLMTGLLIYNVAASALLAYAGAVLELVGVLLWPTVALHAVLAVWSASCLRPSDIAESFGANDASRTQTK
jgi:hypothetical protein